MTMKDVFGTQGMTLEFSSTICVGRRSLGITAKTIPKDEYVVDIRSQCPKHGTGWEVLPFHSFFFFFLQA